MENFDFYSPTYFAFGRDSERRTGELVRRFGGTRVLLHYGGGSAIRSGLVDRVRDSLSAADVTWVELGGVKPNPRSGLVYEGIELCRREEVDFVLAVGGGSVIDSAKAIAAGTVYEGDFWDFYEGRPVTEALPVGTVLTIAAAGSEGSTDSVITKEEGMIKRAASGDVIRPRFSILNPALQVTLPAYQTACGVTDILAHLYERYLTRTPEVEVTDRMIEALMMAVIREGARAVKEPQNYDARANLLWAGMMAHNNSCGVGRTQDWTSHLLEHELSALYDCAHGAGLAVAMPAVFSAVLERDVMRFAKVAVRVWGCDMDFDCPERTARAGVEALKRFLVSIGMPVNFEQLGAREEDIPYLAHTCVWGSEHGDGFVHGFADLSEAEVADIYRRMV